MVAPNGEEPPRRRAAASRPDAAALQPDGRPPHGQVLPSGVTSGVTNLNEMAIENQQVKLQV